MWEGGGGMEGLVTAALGQLDGGPVSGAWSGWSAFGLAGLILAWLFFRHLPDKDKQLKDKDDSHLIQVKELTKIFTDQLKDLVAGHQAADKERRGDFQAALQTVVSHCDRENARLSDTLKIQGEQHTHALTDLRETLEEIRVLAFRMERADVHLETKTNERRPT